MKYNKISSITFVSSQAFSLVNFRGQLIAELVSKGFTVYALAPDYDDELRAKVISLGAQPISYKFSRAGMNPLIDLIATLKLVVILKRLNSDAVLCYFIKPVIFGIIASWLAGVKHRVAMIEGLGYVFTFASNQSFLRMLLRIFVSQLYKFSLARASKVIFLNDDDIRDFVSSGLVEKSKIIKLGGIGVDLNEWSFSPSVTQTITFVLAARLLREKGIEEFAAAARLIKVQHPTVRFVLLGGVDPKPGGLGQIEVLKWVKEELLEWPGHVGVKPWLAQASVFVLPSYYREGVPRSIQEAMSMGKAIITSNSPGCRETVDEGVNGFLVPVRNVEALAQAMLRFVENPSLVVTMGLESRRLAEARFDILKSNALITSVLLDF